MELDKERMENLARQLWWVINKCRFVGYGMTKDSARNKGLYIIDDIVSRSDFNALYSNTDELQNTKNYAHNCLVSIQELRSHYAKLVIELDWYENVLKSL